MRSSLVFALGAGSAMAQFTNSSMPMPTPTNTPDSKAFPNTVGDFKFLGCLTGTFSGFTMMASDDKMTLDLCAASCPSQIMGVVGKECFCADAVDSSASKKDDNSKCNLPCPGMPEQHCGGTPSKMRRADVVPAGYAMTAYMREGGGGGGSSSSSRVSSKTVTSTYVSTITSCAPTVTNCPVGSKTHKVVIETIAVCPQPKWHAKKIVCYSDYCAPEYACEGKHCKHERVICEDDKCHPEECDAHDKHKLVICKGGDCKYSQCQGPECDKKVVCYNGHCVIEQCYGKECDKNMVCKGDRCGWQSCKPGDASCKKEVTCYGDDCKVSPNPTKAMPAPGPKPTQNKDQNNKGQENNDNNNNKGQDNNNNNNNKGQDNKDQSNKDQNNNGQNKDQSNKDQNNNGQNKDQSNNGQNKDQSNNGQNKDQGNNGQNKDQGSKDQNKDQGNNGQNKDQSSKDQNKDTPVVYGKPVSPTAIPVVAGGDKISFSVFAAVFGIFVMA